MRDQVLAVIVAVATFGVVNGGIVAVGLATAEPVATIEAIATPSGAPYRADTRVVRTIRPT